MSENIEVPKEVTEVDLDYICAVFGVDLFRRLTKVLFQRNPTFDAKNYGSYGFMYKRKFVPIPYIQGSNWVTEEGEDWSLGNE